MRRARDAAAVPTKRPLGEAAEPTKKRLGEAAEPTKKLLVIDDEPSVREALTGLFELVGYEVREAGSADAALAAAAEGPYDVALVDVNLGTRSGLDVLRALALGAQGVMIGRAWAFALGAQGEKGVARMLEILRAELAVAMALTGCTDLKQAGAQLVNRS